MITSTFASLSASDLYRILRLRFEVFIVEQHCVYPELDGRDTEPSTLHMWLDAPDGSVAAYLRVLTEPDGSARIGRVVTAAPSRGKGLAGRLMAAALERLGPDRLVVLDAQTVATGLYERFGFVVTGPAYDDEGIAHVPMARRP
ncbi:GNAT family N-acetyltransferase [Dactylosporangium matsuzakiense]|uniref:ElaA protein n=1 Tax=Dactylosporangium matsuzakiense TaxID=53360 RepID=A0A9W6NRR2_9ACTN|nr:GNAT family N-acetyltransferase [Dactylosporangium matsuzakiense]UWZ46535.1 GNAT family N-acetyltransferase [Dactylosporangium matsuzakiense]GLL06673.1 ElaA protein [Dactylosporangium matsuzakiense]